MAELAPSEVGNGAATPPVVSVITIFHNAPVHFFEEAIASVLAQTEQRWELVLVDDGSTDQSSTVARRAVAANPSRMRLLTHPNGVNRGMSASRNLGIEAARGQFVAFLDADDVYLPEKLERQLDVLRSHPEVGIVFGPTPHWWSWTSDPADRQRDSVRRLGVAPETTVRPPELVRAYLERRADTPATCGVLIRRAAISSVGGSMPASPIFTRTRPSSSSFSWSSRRTSRVRPGIATGVIPEAMCEVRIREGEHTDDYSATAPRRYFLEWLAEYFERTRVRDADLRRLLARELWPHRHPRLVQLVATLRTTGRAVLPPPVRRLARRCLRRLQPTDRPRR